MSLFSDNLACPRCGRAVFAVFRCPDRKQGMCPYVQRWSGWAIDMHPGCLFVLFFVAFGVAGVASAHQDRWWLFLVILFAPLLAWLPARQVQLYDQRSRLLIQITTFAGIEVKRRVVKKCEPLLLPLKPVRPLHYPLSIVTLGDWPREPAEDNNRATCVFRAALVDLLLKGLIQIQPVEYYDRGEGQSAHVSKVKHAVVSKLGAWTYDRDGSLEADLQRIIANGNWKESGKDAWLDGPLVYELVRLYFDQNLADPHGILLDAVEKCAAALGLCTIGQTGGFWQSTRTGKWGGPCIEDLHADAQTADDLVEQFKRVDPETWDSLFTQISKGLKSRIEVDSGA